MSGESTPERPLKLALAQTGDGVSLLAFERGLWDDGYRLVAGVDEVGRGPLAGPVVAAAVVFPKSAPLPEGLGDSKTLSPARREQLAQSLHDSAQTSVGIGEASPAEIDRINILRATHMAMTRALAALPLTPDFILVDGRPVPGLPAPSQALVKGDGRSASIAAASIIAKVWRDALMVEFAQTYPGYEFDAHKGYGTKAHLAALQRLGPSPLHRRSFAPVAACLVEGGHPRQGHFL